MDRELRWMVLDLNGFFAAVEQQERPELRGRPVAVAPLASDTTSVIAASTEAKRYGVKCGVPVGLARRMCPDLTVVAGDHACYTVYFERIKAVLDDVVQVAAAPNTDEFHFRLLGDETDPARAREIATALKRALRQRVGTPFTASIGVAPNTFLAKVGSDMRKPDGLVVLPSGELPHALHAVGDLTELVGINRRMKLRLNAHGIFTVAELTAASKEDLRLVWGGRVGEDWWYRLRGYELREPPLATRTLGHSHVLPPEFRNRAGVRAVALRLLGKAAMRLRGAGFWTRGLALTVRGIRGFEASRRIPATQDDRDLIPVVADWLDSADYLAPTATSVQFWDLCPGEAVVPSLFEEDASVKALRGATLDGVNARWGKHAVYLGAIHRARGTAEEKIAFGKTSLLSEGAGDHGFDELRDRLDRHGSPHTDRGEG